MGSDNTKKFSIIGLSAILLVAALVAAVGITRKNNEGAGSDGEIQSSNKAVDALCQPTDYKDTCVKSLSGAGETTDPMELIKAGFNAGLKEINKAIEKSSTIKEAEDDDRTKDALKVCKETLNYSVEDLKRSFDKLGDFDISKLDDYVTLLKVWLTGSLTNQETCIDAFKETDGKASEKMKKLLKTSKEITANGLAMVSEISTIVAEMSLSGASRRLFSYGNERDTPEWVDPVRRWLLITDLNALVPNVTVAQDGSGRFSTIQEAVNLAPKKSLQPFVIQIKAGTYSEYVHIPKHHNNVVLLGEGMDKVTITGNKNVIDNKISTYHTATVAVDGDAFIARGIKMENNAGSAKHQAVALRLNSDMSIIYRCRMDGFQDTLYAYNYRQYYRDCIVSGTVDFIFGNGAALFQNCEMLVRNPGPGQNNMVTAQGRKQHHELSGLVLQNCSITAEADLLKATNVKSYLGRPWKEFSRTIIMQSYIDGFIVPEGWSVWNGNFGLETAYYAEYMNRGPGSALDKRVTWTAIKKITPQEAEQFTGGFFFRDDSWIRATSVPYEPGMMKT